MIRISFETYNCDDLRGVCFRIECNDDLVAVAQRPFTLCNAIEAPHLVLPIDAKEMLPMVTVALNRVPRAHEIVWRNTNGRRGGCSGKKHGRCDNRRCHASNKNR